MIDLTDLFDLYEWPGGAADRLAQGAKVGELGALQADSNRRLTFFLKESVSAEKAPLVVALAMFAALITLGLFRWELRNIQTCSWLRRRAEALEETLVKASGAPAQPRPPWGIGKTEAEKAIYSITILVWLIMPIALIGSQKLSASLPVYVSVAVLIAILTVVSVLGSVRVAGTTARAA